MEEKDAPKSQFESEMTRLMNVVIDRIGGLEKEVSKNSQKLDILTAQFGDVTSTMIEHKKRITKLEGDVADLQSNIH